MNSVLPARLARTSYNGKRSNSYNGVRHSKRYPSDLVHLTAVRNGQFRALVGPDPEFSYIGQVPDDNGVMFTGVPVQSRGLMAMGTYTNLFTAGTGIVEIFGLDVVGAQTITGVFRTKSASDYITVDWGDGTYNQYAGTTDQAYSHTYTVGGKRFRVFATDGSVLTKMTQTNTNSTLGGQIILPSGMTHWACEGNLNTFTETITLPPGMTFWACSGNLNTFTGPITLPSVMTFWYCGGNLNAFTGYTRRTPVNGQRYFSINGATMSLTATDVDNILLDSAMATWTSEKYLRVQGNAPNRTSASDAAYAALAAIPLTTLSVD